MKKRDKRKQAKLEAHGLKRALKSKARLLKVKAAKNQPQAEKPVAETKQ